MANNSLFTGYKCTLAGYHISTIKNYKTDYVATKYRIFYLFVGAEFFLHFTISIAESSRESSG